MRECRRFAYRAKVYLDWFRSPSVAALRPDAAYIHSAGLFRCGQSRRNQANGLGGGNAGPTYDVASECDGVLPAVAREGSGIADRRPSSSSDEPSRQEGFNRPGNDFYDRKEGRIEDGVHLDAHDLRQDRCHDGYRKEDRSRPEELHHAHLREDDEQPAWHGKGGDAPEHQVDLCLPCLDAAAAHGPAARDHSLGRCV